MTSDHLEGGVYYHVHKNKHTERKMERGGTLKKVAFLKVHIDHLYKK